MFFPSDAEVNKLMFSVYAAAALNELLKQQRDAVGLTLFENEITKHLPAKASPLHQKLIYNALEELLETKTQSKTTNAVAALNQIAEVIHKRSLIVIFSDMFDDGTDNEQLFSALQHLKYKKHEVVLFHVVDKSKELDFEFENKPYHFIDLESGEEIKLNPTQIKQQYQQRISTFNETLKARCGQYKIDFVEADINKGFDTILYTYLIKRSLLL
jgi:uncharacterized protein (DUF58 family)